MKYKFYKLTLLATILAFFVTQSALSEASSENTLPNKLIGEALLRACNSNDPTDKGVCFGIVAGSNQMVQLLAAQGLIGYFYCVPGGGAGKIAQLRDIVIKYLEKNPDKRSLPVSSSILFALVDKYPCPKKS